MNIHVVFMCVFSHFRHFWSFLNVFFFAIFVDGAARRRWGSGWDFTSSVGRPSTHTPRGAGKFICHLWESAPPREVGFTRSQGGVEVEVGVLPSLNRSQQDRSWHQRKERQKANTGLWTLTKATNIDHKHSELRRSSQSGKQEKTRQ